jgi:hypothetical protein
LMKGIAIKGGTARNRQKQIEGNDCLGSCC